MYPRHLGGCATQIVCPMNASDVSFLPFRKKTNYYLRRHRNTLLARPFEHDERTQRQKSAGAGRLLSIFRRSTLVLHPSDFHVRPRNYSDLTAVILQESKAKLSLPFTRPPYALKCGREKRPKKKTRRTASTSVTPSSFSSSLPSAIVLSAMVAAYTRKVTPFSKRCV